MDRDGFRSPNSEELIFSLVVTTCDVTREVAVAQLLIEHSAGHWTLLNI